MCNREEFDIIFCMGNQMTMYVPGNHILFHLFLEHLYSVILRYTLYSSAFLKYFRNIVNSHNNPIGLVLLLNFTDRETEALRD